MKNIFFLSIWFLEDAGVLELLGFDPGFGKLYHDDFSFLLAKANTQKDLGHWRASSLPSTSQCIQASKLNISFKTIGKAKRHCLTQREVRMSLRALCDVKPQADSGRKSLGFSFNQSSSWDTGKVLSSRTARNSYLVQVEGK